MPRSRSNSAPPEGCGPVPRGKCNGEGTGRRQWLGRCFALRLSVPALAASGLVRAQAAPGVTASAILLGQSASFSGSFAGQAASYRDGALACFAAVNAAGGIHGRRIRLLSVDDAYDAQRATENTRRLIEEDQVFALFNPMWTNTVKAALALSAPAGVPMIGPYTGYEALYAEERAPVFTTRASFLDELAYIVRHLRTLGATRIGLLHYDSASGRELRADTERLMQPAGLKPSAIGSMQANAADPATAMAALGAVDLQALIVGISGSDAVAFLRAFRRARPSARCYARSLIGITQLMNELGPLAEGVSVSQTAPNPHRERAVVAAEYRRLLAALNPALKPDHIGLDGLISAKVMVEALRRCGPQPTRAGLVAAMESLREIDVGGYVLRYGPGRHHGSRFVDITLIGSQGRILD
jgi:branched-chain amino acid transport system substrate-binding protein